MKKFVLLCTLASFLLGGVAMAEEAGQKTKSGQLEELESITVTSSRTQHTLADVPEETIVITAAELDKLNVTNTLEALRWIPGMAVSLHRGAMGGDTFQMNESATEDVLVLVDGNRTKGNYAISELPVSTIERIEIVKGGNSVLYGNDALAGVINIITKKPSDKVSGSVKMVVTHDRTKSGTAPKDYRMETATQEASIGFATAGLRHLYTVHRDHRELYSYDGKNISGKWGLDLNDKMELGLGFGYNTYKQSSTENDKYRANLNFDWKTDLSTLKLKSFYRHYKDHLHPNAMSPTERIEKNDFYEQEILYTVGIFDNNLLTVGYQYTQDELDKTERNKRNKYSMSSNSVILQDELTFFDILTLAPAVRVHSYNDWKSVNVDPKLSILWRATDRLSIRATGATAYRTPDAIQLYSDRQHPAGPAKILIFQGNPDLKPEKSKSVRLSAEQRIGNFFIGNLALFRTEYEDQIKQYIDKVTDTHTYYKYKNVDGGSITQGVEASAKYWLTDKFLLGMGYTYFDTEDKKTGKTLQNTVEHRLMPSVRYQDDELGLVAELKGNYEKYANQSKGYWYKMMGKEYYSPGHDELNGKDNFFLNASLSKQLSDSTKVWLNGENLLNRKKTQAMAKDKMVLILGLECKF